MKFSKRFFGSIFLVLLLHGLAGNGFAAPRPPLPPWPQATIKIYGFDSASARVPWRDLAINETEANLTESWSGYALSREGFISSPVVIPVRSSEKELNVAPANGAVRFWFAPSWSTASKTSGGKGPGHAARLLELVNLNGKKAQTRWSLFLNDAGDTLSLVGETKLGAAVLLQAPVEFVAGDWRMITLCYSEDATEILLDGVIIGKGEGLVAPASWDEKNLGLVVGSDVLAAADSVAEGQFEELTLLAHWPKKSELQELYFQATKRHSLLGPQGTKEEEQAKVVALKKAGLLPEAYGSMAKSSGEGDGPMMLYSYASGTLWLEITSISNNLAHLIVHGTTADVAYEILSKESLTNTEWAGEQPIILGAPGQDWTATTVTIGTRTNELFFWARVLSDADGDGLPDWWELAHGLDPNNPDTSNTAVSDGYKDSDNDGWSNLQEYQNGTSPSQFNTSPPPRNVSARFDVTGTNIIVTWESGGGPVVTYDVEYNQNTPIIQSLSPSTRTATFALTPAQVANLIYSVPRVAARAHFPDTSSSVSLTVSPARISLDAKIVRGPGGAHYFVASSLPVDLAVLRFSYRAFNSTTFQLEHHPWFDVAATNLVNGQLVLPTGQIPYGVQMHYQFIFTDGSTSTAVSFFQNASREDWSFEDQTRKDIFVDARQHLKENLRFLLRAATINYPFSFTSGFSTAPGAAPLWPWDDRAEYPEYYYARAASPTNYEYSGFHIYSPYQTYSVMMPARPVQDHYLWRNFVYNPVDFSAAGAWTNGFGYDNDAWLKALLNNTKYRFTGVASNAPPAPLAFDSATSAWLYYRGITLNPGNPEPDGEVGLFAASSGYYLTPNTRNCYGLLLNSLRTGPTNYYLPGTTFLPNSYYLIPEFAQPDLQTVDYYFASQTARLTYWYDENYDLTGEPTPLPGAPNFSNTSTSPLLLTGFGQQLTVSGWAKQAIANGYNDSFGYLQQYFDKAYTTTNGVVTTNQTGILSPYGEFFPTEPGRTALVTMPDLDTGARGTATVYVVSMNLDANHDGAMDRTFYGPDQTSANRPFQFWINNDNDAADYSNGYEADTPGVPDNRDNEIKSKRDLEDFARLWISGVPSLPPGQGYTITLSSSGPVLQLFPAYEADGGIGYLTNATTAANQITSSSRLALGLITPNNNYVFPDGYFANFGRKHFLFEGITAGAGTVTLTIAQGTNILMQTSLFMDLRDVKEMYEQAHAQNVTSGIPPSTLVSEFKLDRMIEAASDETKQIIIFVHGINNTEFDCIRGTETIFKRLYWSGYHGRVSGFRWPCAYLPFENTLNPFNYNKGEFYAYKSAKAFKDYLSYLTNRMDLTGYSISILAHSQGTAVVGEALIQGAPFQNYIITQGAIPAHCFDGSAPTLQKLLDAETNKATAYIASEGGYHLCYTNVSGNIINFFNTNDFALATGVYLGQQANWEENQRSQKPESFAFAHSYFFSVSTHFTYRQLLSQFTQVTDLQEIRSMDARSRTKAVGAQGGLGGILDGQVDLSEQLGFGSTRPEHSAQFARPIQTVLGYYRTLLIQTQPIP